MIISTNWLKQYTDIDLSIDDLAKIIGSRLVEIEDVIDLGKKYQGIVIAKVVKVEKLESSDHLNVVLLDDNGVVRDVDRNDEGFVQVVCGAPNVRKDLHVVWLPPKSVVPETYNNDPFILSSRKLRGVVSNGMIASPRELDLFDEHEGIIEIDESIKPGTLFSEAFDLNDYLLDIENKSLTHRPDTFGIVGFAREVSAIQNKKFVTPKWLENVKQDSEDKISSDVSIAVDNIDLSSRYQGVVLHNVNGNVKSPLSLQICLAKVGMRPISAIVDVTNYLMLATGQPLHAFDYDKLAAVNDGRIEIHVRGGKTNETLKLLDGRTIELSENDIVIANGSTPVALAGAMGGAETEIDENTKNVFLESATFNLYNLRATQMRHGIFSEAITRFTKGQPAELTEPVLNEAIRLIKKNAGFEKRGNIVESYPNRVEVKPIVVSLAKINHVLGTKLSYEEVARIMENVEFDVGVSDDDIFFTAPYWRSDIHIDEDVIEEIGRLNGFDLINPVLPIRACSAVQPVGLNEFKSNVRKLLVRTGANEVLTYSFIHGDILEKADLNKNDSFRITNSISPDLQYYRQSLTPSLLNMVHGNIKQGFDEFALFEINKVHTKALPLNKEGVPEELERVALVMASKNDNANTAYYKVKRMLDFVAKQLSLELDYIRIDEDSELLSALTQFDSRRSAIVVDKKSKNQIGVIGEYKKKIAKSFKLPDHSAGFELDMYLFNAVCRDSNKEYKSPSKFPSTDRDICFQVDQSVQYGDIVDAANDVLDKSGLDALITPVDIYKGEGMEVKNVTIRIKLTSYEKTLVSDEIALVIDNVISAVVKDVKAKVI